MILCDTNVIIEVFKGNESIINKLGKHTLILSIIVLIVV